MRLYNLWGKIDSKALVRVSSLLKVIHMGMFQKQGKTQQPTDLETEFKNVNNVMFSLSARHSFLQPLKR